jgi:hypothetical protein
MRRIASAFVIAAAMAVLVIGLDVSGDNGSKSEPAKSAPRSTITTYEIHATEAPR